MADHDRRVVYILRGLTDPARHYVGLTANLPMRLAAHDAGQSPHTAKSRPWSLVASLEFADEDQAAGFEKYLKSGSGRAFAKRHFA